MKKTSQMNIKEINEYPELYNDVMKGSCHESLLKSYHALQKVLDMTKRGDSAETILEVAELLGYASH